MKIEIWSDIACPFCYIGKKHLEEALSKFEGELPEIEWKAFLLNPTQQYIPGKTVNQYLSESKGIPLQQVEMMQQHVMQMGEKAGIHFNMDSVQLSNTTKGHYLIQFAQQHGKGTEVKEALMKAYFEEGKVVEHDSVLESIANQFGLDFSQVLGNSTLEEKVNADLEEASAFRIQGVPFFVFDRKFAVSGAQPLEVFESALQKAVEDAQ